MKQLFIIFWLCSITGLCGCIMKNDVSAQVLNNNVSAKNILRYDGLYNTYDTSTAPCGEKTNEHYKTYNPLLVINGSKMVYEYGGGALDHTELSLTFYSKMKYYIDCIGNYYIVNNTLYASIPVSMVFNGQRLKLCITHFEGTIKSRDTIINWHMVPPYPKAPKKFNNDFKDLIQPKMLYFIESKELLGLDSLYQAKLKEQNEH